MEIVQTSAYNAGMTTKNNPDTTEPLPDIDLVKLVKAVRNFAGLSQKELAEKLSCSRRNVEDWERGVSAPSGQYLAKLFLLRDRLIAKLEIPIDENSQENNQPVN